MILLSLSSIVNEHNCEDENVLAGESYNDQRPIKLSKKMQKIIDNSQDFTAKPIGPLYKHLSENFTLMLPSAFLHCYIVANYEDSEMMAQLCREYKEKAPERIIRDYHTTIYEDVLNDLSADSGVVDLLKKENPIVANVLIDYFEIHKQSKFILCMCCCSLLWVQIESSGTIWYPPNESFSDEGEDDQFGELAQSCSEFTHSLDACNLEFII